MDPHRAERLAEALRAELQELVSFELQDPEVGEVDIAALELSPDDRKAVARVMAHGSEDERNQSLAALDRARAFLKRQVAQNLDLSRVPEIYFEAASDAGAPERVQRLLKRARRGRPRDQKKPEE